MLHRLTTAFAAAGEASLMAERLSEAEPAPALATAVFEEDGGRSWRLDAYFEVPPDRMTILASLTGLEPVVAPLVVEVPDENWVAISQAALPPVHAGRFLVHGSHDREKVGRRQWSFEIEAGEAFGTAHHATTEGCLLALDRLAHTRRFRNILDLGCGSGVLAIAAARSWPQARVTASDIDPIAVEVASANVALNRSRRRVACLAASGFAHPRLRATRRFDLVLANILAGPLIDLAPSLTRRLCPGGIAILSGILAEQAREVAATYRSAGFRLQRSDLRHGWTTLVLELP